MTLTTEQLEVIKELTEEYEDELEEYSCFGTEREVLEYGEKFSHILEPDKFRESMHDYIQFRIDEYHEDYDEEDEE